MRRATRLKMKPTQAPPGSPRGAFSFAGRYTHHIGLVPKAAAPATYLESTMGLLDQAHSFAQGASNGVAGSLTGPVDGLAWLLRKAGVPVPQAPLGGSDWMRNVGLMQEPKERMAGLLGEGIGSALPTVIAGKAPQIANGLLQMERNAMAPRTLNPQTGAIVWHGSPHKFDKFDSNKIGTGEGAQAYGHGLYLAESDDVARSYQQSTQRPEFLVNGEKWAMDQGGVVRSPQGKTTATLPLDQYNAIFGLTGSKANKPLSELAEEAESFLQTRSGMTPAKIAAAKKAILDGKIKLNAETGSLYKVDLPDDQIAKMLDWDKPISEQPQAVRDALAKLPKGWATGSGGQRQFIDPAMSRKTGGGLLEELKMLRRGQPEELLKQQGIPGIRYLDGGSRAGGAGTSNYVVFPGNEGLLKILERNGQGLLGN